MKKLASQIPDTKATVMPSRFAAVLLLAASAAIVPAQAAIAPSTSTGTNGVAPVSNSAVHQFVSDAQKALRSGNAGLAIILLKNAVRAAPKDAMLRAQLGVLELQTGDPVSAERDLRQARADGAPPTAVLPPLFQAMFVRHEEQKLLNDFPDPGTGTPVPGTADILKARSQALQALGHPEDAVAAMDRSLALRRDIPGLLSRARLAEAQHDTALAKKLSDESLKLDPKSIDALNFKLALLMLSNDTNGALELSQTLIASYPNNLGARLARIELFLKLKQDTKAKTEVDAILARAPTAPIGLYYKAVLMARANDVKGAWRIVQALPPEFTQSQPAIAMMVAQMAISSGELETGAAILSSALARAPNSLDLRVRIAAIRLRQHSPEAALSVLQPVKDSSDPQLLALLSQVYLMLKKYSDALEVLNKLNTSGSSSTGVRRELALVELQTGQTEQGLKDLIDLVTRQPTDPTVVAPLVAALSKAHRYEEALKALDRLAVDPTQRVQALFLRGQVLILQGDSQGAMAALQQALQLDPKNIAALYFRGGLFEAATNYAAAVRDFDAILAMDPKNVAALVKLAEVAARQNDDKTVRATLSRSISIAPSNPTPRLALVRYLTDRHDLKGALAAATDGGHVLPENTDFPEFVGELQLALGQKDDAILTFRALATLLPRSAKPQLLLANALFANGDRNGAVAALAAAAAVEPNSGDVRAAQINYMFAQRDVTGAITSAKAFQTANPGTPSDLLLADTLIRANQRDQAATVLKQSFASKPDHSVLLRLVELASNTADRTKSKAMMNDWLIANPHDIEVRQLLASQLMLDGDLAKATSQYETILKENPNYVPALNNLAWMLQNSNPKRALAMSLLAVKLSPASPDALDTVGTIKLQMKDPKSAADYLNRAHVLRPNDGEITYHLVLALDASGNRKSAKGLLSQLLSSDTKFADAAKARQLSATWH